MSEEVIDRVDELIRKNNIKYKDEQSQKAYEQALKQYEKQAKFELTKQYGSMVKEGNRKAREKAKEIKAVKEMKKKKKNSVALEPNKQKKNQKKEEVKVIKSKAKLSEAELQMFNKTVQARAERILQEQQLQKLTKRLGEQKKRTKLYELNERCKKMLSKSHERIFPARNLSESKMEVLKRMQEKACGEIRQLDNIISNLVDQSNQTKNNQKERPQTCLNIKPESIQRAHLDVPASHNEEDKWMEEDEEFPEEVQQYLDSQSESEDQHFSSMLNLNTLIFEKSPEELLKMNYIPI